MHFSEIIKLQFEKKKKTPYIVLYFTVFFFRIVVAKRFRGSLIEVAVYSIVLTNSFGTGRSKKGLVAK